MSVLIKKSIRNKLIVSIFIGCLIPYFIGGSYLKNFMEKRLYAENLTETNRLLYQISELIDKSLIENVEDTVKMLSENPELKAIDDSITDYTNYLTKDVGYNASELEQKINMYFTHVKESHRSYNFIFMGTEFGGYIEYPRFMPSGVYDPRQRPWYMNTLDSDEIVISDPYITQVTQEMVLSFTKKVIENNKTVGVVGISVKIDDLTKNIGNINLIDDSSVIVLNDHNKIVVSNQNPEWILKTPEELNLEMFEKYSIINSNSYESKFNNEEKVISVYVSPSSNWKVLAIVSKDEIVKKSKEMTNILLIIFLLTQVIIFVVIFVISKKITDPILNISKAIDKMSVFDVEFYKVSNIDNYQNSKDEIGIIAKALAGMQKSFVELNHTIEHMNEEIINIDIEKDEPVNLKISKTNPFNNVAESFNALLNKTYAYLQQNKESNTEIVNKNQMLTASEEELTAQLEEIESQRDFINFLAYHDPLTNLPNRRWYIEKLETALAHKLCGAVILLDLDNFKSINDTLGHVYGDKVLQSVAKRIEEISSNQIFVSRFGGDEFLILVENENDLNQINALVKNLNHIFDDVILVEENEIDIAFSMGISIFPQDSNTVDQLIMNADLALYAVKNQSKNGYKFFDSSMTEHLYRKSWIENIIKEALDSDGFKMVYQPQVHLESGEVHAYEALIRFKNHNISPAEFIPIAEENDAIIKIGRVVTRHVIEQLRKWLDKGYPVKPVSINFSATQLHDSKYFDFIIAELQANKVNPNLIEIEITENIFLENKDQTHIFLTKLRAMGIKISIDDFGTGYSSLSYLTFLPIDKIKLDRSLNDKFLEIENIKVMDSLIMLAHSLNLEVVAEGIEKHEQYKRLRVGKCDYIQGYYFSKPIEVEVLESEFGINYYNK